MSNIYSSFLNKTVIIRTFSAGVHYGTLQAINDKTAHLTSARRIWYWSGAFTLSEIANKGLDTKLSKLSIAVPDILLTEAIEVISVSQEAERVLNSCPTFQP